MNAMRIRPRICAMALGALIAAPAVAVDLDNDGVSDTIDECCDTPAGVMVDRAGRPLGDLDGDCDVDLFDFRILQRNMTGGFSMGCCTDIECDDLDPCTLDLCNVTTGVCSNDEIPNCNDCAVAPSCTEVFCDEPLVSTTDPAIETDTYCFCATEGEIVRINVTKLQPSGAGYQANWRLLDANGVPFGGCGAFATTVGRDCGPLIAAGNPYRIEIEDSARNDIGTYSLHLMRLPEAVSCDVGALLCDQPRSGNIENSNDSDHLSFVVNAVQTVRISPVEGTFSGANFSPAWRLINRLGMPVPPCDTSATTARECGPLHPSLSPFTVEVEDQGRNDSGEYFIHMQRLIPVHACDYNDLECEEPVASTINHIADTDLFGFSAAEGETVRVTVLETLPSGANFNPQWRILNAQGTPSSNCSSFSATASRECGPLSAAGSPYVIEVEDGSKNDTGTYEVRFIRFSAARACELFDLNCFTPVNGTIDDAADSDLIALEVPHNEVARVSVLERAGSGPNFAPNWRLLNASGVPTSNCSGFSPATSRDCGPLPLSGNPYMVEVEDQGRNDAGLYQVLLDHLTTGCPQ